MISTCRLAGTEMTYEKLLTQCLAYSEQRMKNRSVWEALSVTRLWIYTSADLKFGT